MRLSLKWEHDSGTLMEDLLPGSSLANVGYGSGSVAAARDRPAKAGIALIERAVAFGQLGCVAAAVPEGLAGSHAVLCDMALLVLADAFDARTGGGSSLKVGGRRLPKRRARVWLHDGDVQPGRRRGKPYGLTCRRKPTVCGPGDGDRAPIRGHAFSRAMTARPVESAERPETRGKTRGAGTRQVEGSEDPRNSTA